MRMLALTLIVAGAALAGWFSYVSRPQASPMDKASSDTAYAARFASTDNNLRAVLPTDAGLHLVWTVCDLNADTPGVACAGPAVLRSAKPVPHSALTIL